MQRNRQMDVVPPEIRAQHRANNPDTREVDLAEWKRKNAESMRILEENDKRRQEQMNSEG